MVLNATLNNISAMSCRLVLLVEETGIPRENTDLPQVRQTISHNVVSTTPQPSDLHIHGESDCKINKILVIK